jgi:RND family efflux transporter MFP subunit
MGAIMAIGVASANSILLVTFAGEQQLAGMSAFDAAIAAGRTRIRPVLMTAAAMIVGMIPMAIGGAGEEQNAALARAVIGGLLFATPTTLLGVPYLFATLRRGQRRKISPRRLLGGFRMNHSRYFPAALGDAELYDGPRDAELFGTSGRRVPGRAPTEPLRPPSKTTGKSGRRLLAIGALLSLGGALGLGVWQHIGLHAQVTAAAEHRREFVPTVRTAAVRASDNTMAVTWPATTEAFEQANIYARASGYISRRGVDIGSRVKAGQPLVEITAPELDHQIAQAEATLVQLQASLQQAIANRALAQVTWDRDRPLVQKGWVTPQQGDTDRLNLQAREAAVAVAQANITSQEAQLRVLKQQKAYQSVVAPFDGVITQRNIDVGDLVQADAASGTFLFTLMHGDTIRIRLYVPQDQAFGISPGVEAVIRVPEMPGREFPGTVTRIADALQPGTRTLLTEVDVPNSDRALSPGIYCSVELKIPRKTPSLIVPSEAIVFNRDGLSVAVVENGIARIRPIALVRDFGTTVEVSAGVKEGDQVVLNPAVDLTDGRELKISSSATERRS